MYVIKIKLCIKYMEQIKKYVTVAQEIILYAQAVELYTNKTTTKTEIMEQGTAEKIVMKNS
jgi:hypothetical protein